MDGLPSDHWKPSDSILLAVVWLDLDEFVLRDMKTAEGGLRSPVRSSSGKSNGPFDGRVGIWSKPWMSPKCCWEEGGVDAGVTQSFGGGGGGSMLLCRAE